MAKYLKQPNKAQGAAAKLKRARRNVFLQAGLAVLTIVLTIIIVFSMTAAWYTNIVQTSGLMFQAQAWGFDGTVEVDDSPITAAPGDEGVVHLVVTNDNESVTSLSVNISKSRMEEEMRKRIYFYVDAQQTRNGENVDRLYLSNQESFTYTLFSQGDLILTETMHNNAQLKWQWVYDVLGYYVLGRETTDTEGNPTVEVLEYLRPIEYDYDEATTTFTYDEAGNLIMQLATVDGTTTVDEFLKEFSRTDGYAGIIDPNDPDNPTKKTGDYYHVDVGTLYEGVNVGYGVYAYMLTYSEIEMGIQYDTQLGQAAAGGQATPINARLTISAQARDSEIVTARSLADLKTAIASGESDVIQLTDNIIIPADDPLTLVSGQRVMVDLNGYDLICESTDKAIDAQPGSALTLTNGDLTGTGSTSYAVYTVGAEVTMSNVNVTGFQRGVYLADDQADNALDSRVRLVDCTLDTTGNTITVMGNGSASAQTTQLVLEGCTITSDSMGIACNGTSSGLGKWGTDIQVIDTTITCDPNTANTGIYHPQKYGVLTIYNSTISAYTGICVKGGDISVIDSQISGQGAKQDPVFWPSGFADTGDGIYIETNYYYPITLEISGNSVISSTYGYSLQVYDSNDADHVTVIIESGTFQDQQPDAYIAEGSSQTEVTDGYQVTVDPVETGEEETTETTAAPGE